MNCGESLLDVEHTLYLEPKLSFEVLVDVTNNKLVIFLLSFWRRKYFFKFRHTL